MAAKWPKILLGCAVLLVLVCVGVPALVWFAFPDVRRMIQEEFTKTMDWEQFAQTWQPPPRDAGPERLFPAAVGDFRKEKDDDQAAVPNLEIVMPGRRASYESGQEVIEVFAFPGVARGEQEALFKKLNAKPFTMKMEMHTNNFARFTYATGQEKGVLWWSRDWLFLARGKESSDPEKFLRAYLDELQKAPAPDQKPAKDQGKPPGDF
jgi:hypothetical protein